STLVFLDKIQIGVQHLTKETLQNCSRCLRGDFQTAPELPGAFDHEIDEKIVFTLEVQIESAYRELCTLYNLLDPKRTKSLRVNHVASSIKSPTSYLRIRSAKTPALTPRCSNSFYLLQLSYSLSMNVI